MLSVEFVEKIIWGLVSAVSVVFGLYIKIVTDRHKEAVQDKKEIRQSIDISLSKVRSRTKDISEKTNDISEKIKDISDKTNKILDILQTDKKE